MRAMAGQRIKEAPSLRRFGWRLLPVAVAAAAAGCSFSPNEWLRQQSQIDYKSERRLERPLEMPPDLVHPAQGERFTLPQRGSATFSAYQSERQGAVATPTTVLPTQPGMRIERAGETRWLVVAATPEQVWPRLKRFWEELGFSLAMERPDLGVMETHWAENRAKIPDDIIRRTLGRLFDALFSTGERDKFRTRVEPGRNPGEVEIYIAHRGMVEVYTSQQQERTVWQPRPPDPELEAEMLRRLMVYLGAEEQRAKAAVDQAVAQDRAMLRVDAALAELELRDGFDRAWRRVGLALDRLGFSVLERDSRKGEYRVRYDDPALAEGQERGFWSRLAFWRKEDRPKPNTEYRLVVEGSSTSSRVTVRTEEGVIDTSPTAKQILQMLFEELR